MDLSNAPSRASQEEARLAALRDVDILDTPGEQGFDDIIRLAANALAVECAAISLIDADRQWFKARHGFDMLETARDVSFCTHAVAARNVLVVPDATEDARFRDNPYVACEGGVRFYAGFPLMLRSGHCLGTLCVFDSQPRSGLTQTQQETLRDLALLASDLIEARQLRRMGDVAVRLVDRMSEAVVVADGAGIVSYWNPGAEALFGLSAARIVGRDMGAMLASPGSLEVVLQQVPGAADTGLPLMLEARHADGGTFPIALTLIAHDDAQGRPGFAAILRDTRLLPEGRHEAGHERSHAFLSSIVTNLPAMLYVKDAQTRRYVMVNRAGEALLDDLPETDSPLPTPIRPEVTEREVIRHNGERRHLRTTRTLIDGPDRAGQYILAVAEDVTQAKKAEAEVLRLAHHDSLTGLYNRASFTERLHHMVRGGKAFALLSIDLDRFKVINDQFGHPAGDAVLQQVGSRLQALQKGGGWAARIGGDEFIVMLTGVQLRTRAEAMAGEIILRMAQPFVTERGVAHTGASVGVVITPEDGTTTKQLRENVDLALYRSKRHGGVCFFNAAMDAAARDRRRLEKDLRAAIHAGELTLAYQPVFAADTLRITSVEALARWTHPERGPISADTFIPIAEESGMIDRLGEQLLLQACQQARQWPAHVRVAVNLSPLQFMSGLLPRTVGEALEISGLDPDRLQLEVTEGLVIRDVEGTFRQLEDLRGLGVQVLIDDFGVGYSSLRYFQRFRFDKVKIDKSFISDIATSPVARAIIQAVVALGQQLGMGVVAEGVETEKQAEILKLCGCTHLQGYLFSRPLPEDALMQVLRV